MYGRCWYVTSHLTPNPGWATGRPAKDKKIFRRQNVRFGPQGLDTTLMLSRCSIQMYVRLYGCQRAGRRPLTSAHSHPRLLPSPKKEQIVEATWAFRPFLPCLVRAWLGKPKTASVRSLWRLWPPLPLILLLLWLAYCDLRQRSQRQRRHNSERCSEISTKNLPPAMGAARIFGRQRREGGRIRTREGIPMRLLTG
jgi:hypothetical protein